MYSRDGDRASRQGYPHSTGGADGATAHRAMVQGKRTLVEGLQARSGVIGAPSTVQRKAAGRGGYTQGTEIHLRPGNINRSRRQGRHCPGTSWRT
jgi:hypothetical protein